MTASNSSLKLNALAVYGTLQPGGPNEHILKPLGGVWVTGQVRGKLFEAGWGASQGFPGIRLGDEFDYVPVQVLISVELESFWAQLDDFEGQEYVRSVCHVQTEQGPIEAYIYELA